MGVAPCIITGFLLKNPVREHPVLYRAVVPGPAGHGTGSLAPEPSPLAHRDPTVAVGLCCLAEWTAMDCLSETPGSGTGGNGSFVARPGRPPAAATRLRSMKSEE